jgi:hypothetical protein
LMKISKYPHSSHHCHLFITTALVLSIVSFSTFPSWMDKNTRLYKNMMVNFHSIKHTNMQSWLITDPQNPWAGCLVLYRDAFIIHLVLDVFAVVKLVFHTGILWYLKNQNILPTAISIMARLPNLEKSQ